MLICIRFLVVSTTCGTCKKKLPSTGVRRPVGQAVHTCTYARACTHTYLSYIYVCLCEELSTLKVLSTRMFTALLRLLANVCQWSDTDAALRPVHECVVICRKMRTQQTVTVHSCQKNTGVVNSFTWLLAHLTCFLLCRSDGQA